MPKLIMWNRYLKRYLQNADLENYTAQQLFNQMKIQLNIPINQQECERIIQLFESENLILYQKYLR